MSQPQVPPRGLLPCTPALRVRLAGLPAWGVALYATLAASLMYMATYFLMRPVFVLPESYLGRPVVAGSRIDRQTALAVAQAAGYFLAKFPAVYLMSSPRFFRNRAFALIALNVLAAAFMGVGFWALDSSGLAQAVVAGGLSALPSSAVYGGLVTYLEGRAHTELMLAGLNLSIVLAGGAARGLGAGLLVAGVAPQVTPAAACGVGIGLVLPLVLLLDATPAQSEADKRERGKRGAMACGQQLRFIWRFLAGIVGMLVAYLIVMSLRAYRDYYALELYTDALARAAGGGGGGTRPSASLYFLADLPGGLVSAGALALIVRVRDSLRALLVMMAVMIAGAAVVALSTALHDAGLISGVVWLSLTGLGIYSAYLPMGSAFYDRLLAASATPGTMVFLQFLSDGMGWAGSITLLLLKSFAAPPINHSPAPAPTPGTMPTPALAPGPAPAPTSGRGVFEAGPARAAVAPPPANNSSSSSSEYASFTATFRLLSYGAALAMTSILFPLIPYFWWRLRRPSSASQMTTKVDKTDSVSSQLLLSVNEEGGALDERR